MKGNTPQLQFSTEAEEIKTKELQRKAMIMRLIVGAMVIVVYSWSIAEWVLFSRKIQAIIEFLGGSLGVLVLWWQKKSRNDVLVAKGFCVLLTTGILLVNYTYITGHQLGMGASNTFWFFIVPPIVFFLAGAKVGLVATLVVGLWMSVFFVLTQRGILGKPAGYEYMVDLITAFVTVSGFLYLYDRLREVVQSDLETALTRGRTVLNTIKDGIIVIDAEDKIRVFNRAAEQLLGWKRGEVLLRDIDVIIKNHEEELYQIDSLDISQRPHLKLQTKGGNTIYVNLTTSPLLLAAKSGKSNRGVMLTLHDVTEEQELERMKLDFVAMAAHELRTPITSVTGYLSVLQEEGNENLTSEQKSFITRALISSKRLTALMENLLSVTRIERGETTIQRRLINWEELILEKLDEFRPLAKERGLELEWLAAERSLPQVFAERLRICEVLDNLLDNALIYTRKGKISVWCEHDESRGVLVTHIKDTGVGIPKESMPHLFEKFYRISRVLEEGSKGSGLGLYIAKSIVNMHEGEIWADSVLGKGSAFSFSLPTHP